MKIVELTNLSRKDTHVYYRREFKADAVVEYLSKKRSIAVEFTLEHSPLGSIDIKATIKENLDFPVLPLLANLKSYVSDLEKRGFLP